MISRNDLEVTLTKQVEQKEVYTINTITRDIIDLESKKKVLLGEIEEIDAKISGLEDIKTEVSDRLIVKPK